MVENRPSAETHLYLREESVRDICEAFLLAWRGLNRACEPFLTQEGLGVAHHRILFLIGSYEVITPGGLIGRLGITKQSLGRALKELKERGFLEQYSDENDRRRRPLRLTEAGRLLEGRLFALWREQMMVAYRRGDERAVEGFRRILSGLADSVTL